VATWSFSGVDNGGKHHNYTIKASSKDEAIRKAFEKVRKNAKGDLYPTWNCRLIRA